MKEFLSTHLDIQAPADKVWDLLMNFEGYNSWNPFIQKISGKSSVGSILKIQLNLEGRKPMVISPRVVIYEPQRHFAWQGKLLFRGLFDGEHHFKLQELNASSCRFEHFENFSGILVPVFRKMLNRETRAAFERMNQKLKELAEGRKD